MSKLLSSLHTSEHSKAFVNLKDKVCLSYNCTFKSLQFIYFTIQYVTSSQEGAISYEDFFFVYKLNIFNVRPLHNCSNSNYIR